MRAHARYYYKRMSDEQLQEIIDNYKNIIEDFKEIKPGLVQQIMEKYYLDLDNDRDDPVETAYLYQLVIAELYDRSLYVEDLEYILH